MIYVRQFCARLRVNIIADDQECNRERLPRKQTWTFTASRIWTHLLSPLQAQTQVRECWEPVVRYVTIPAVKLKGGQQAAKSSRSIHASFVMVL